jgi:hypothetical protein
LIKFRARVC